MDDIFTQERMQRCADIAMKILFNWQRTNSLAYTVRATDSVAGISLPELRKRTFSVGVGDDLTDLPLNDVLAVFSILQKQYAALKQHTNAPPGNFTISVQMSGDWSDEEAAQLLSQLQIETPFDADKHLRIPGSSTTG
jgi:hypothetical protein